jgi:hypothetical protein
MTVRAVIGESRDQVFGSAFPFTVSRNRQMTKGQAKPYGKRVKELMAEKSRLLSKAQAFEDMGLAETAQSLWSTAASYEERIAPLLDAIGRDAEAALHRVSAAACFEKSDDWSRAANLYRAALAGPLSDAAKRDVERKLSVCLKRLQQAGFDSVA